jgi:hypothetical protein
MKKLFFPCLISFLVSFGYYSLNGQFMTSIVNSPADDEFAYPWDDPNTPDNDESVDGVCEDEQHRCTLRAALEEAYFVGLPASVTFQGNIVIIINEDKGPFDIPEGSRIYGEEQQITILGHGESTISLVGVNTKTTIEGMVLGNALIGMTVGDSNIIGSGDPLLTNFIGNMSQEGIFVGGSGNRITGNVIGLDNLDAPAQNTFGIRVYGNGNIIEGNVISGNDIGLTGYTIDSLAGPNYIINNNIGTNRGGSEARGNRVGLDIIGPGFIIGGSSPDSGNVISGNFEEGILIGIESKEIIIENNHIGVNENGSIPIPNRDGITLGPGSSFVDVTHNVISRNTNNGILVSGILGIESFNHLIAGNEISFNGNAGIQFSGQALENRVGSSLTTDYEANHIIYNGRVGVGFEPGFAGTPAFNTIRKNYFENNTIEGISIIASQENILPPADLVYNDLVVFGTYPIPGAVIDVYEGLRNNSGKYEGNVWLGSAVVNVNGVVDIDVTLCTCDTLVATATSPSGSTSEFSAGIPTTITSTDEMNPLDNISVHPNPFNQTAFITFTLNAAQHVTLKIFDFAGREMESLADQKLQAGEHHFTWQPKGKSEGVYYYQLVSNDFNIKLGKMVLIE